MHVFNTLTWHIEVLALLWFVAHHFNGQVGWVSLHLVSLLLLLPCWWSLPLWTCFDTVPSPCMEGGSSPASQEGLGQLRGAAQLTTSQLSSAPLQSLVHHCMHHCTDCAGGQWHCQHKWQEDWQSCHCLCELWARAGHCVKKTVLSTYIPTPVFDSSWQSVMDGIIQEVAGHIWRKFSIVMLIVKHIYYICLHVVSEDPYTKSWYGRSTCCRWNDGGHRNSWIWCNDIFIHNAGMRHTYSWQAYKGLSYTHLAHCKGNTA